MRTIRVLALLAALALTAAGCARGGPSADAGSSTGMATDSIGQTSGGVSCDATELFEPTPTASAAPLAPGFVPVAATRCLLSQSPTPGDGVWLVRIEQRVDGGLAALTTALRQPDGTAAPGTACTLIGYLPTIITLVDATGATTVPTIPRDGCGAPQPAALAAIEALPWQTVTESRLRQVTSELASASGCSGHFKPVVALAAADGAGTATAGPVFAQPPTTLSVCRYALDPTDSYAAGGGEWHPGVLTGAGTLDGTALATLLAALAAAPPAAPCAVPEAPFAVIMSKDEPSRFVAVETGGCHRFVDDANRLRQLDPATTALLSA